MDIFTQLSLIIVVVAIIAGVTRLLKQPLVIGYILTGLILGPLGFGYVNVEQSDTLSVFSEMGIAILLFIVGLHLSPKEAKAVGKSALLIGIFQVFLTLIFGWFISKYLGFHNIASLYIGVGLAFSSTIVVLKFLSDKRELETLHGRISVGILLLQDIIAAIVLIGANAFTQNSFGVDVFLLLMIKGLGITLVLALFGYYILPKLSSFFAKSQEILFLFAIAWGFGLATLFDFIGFSIEIGALVAGIVLSITTYSEEISSRLRPLRDFFVVMFFVILGSRVSISSVSSVIVPTIILSAFVLIGKPLIIMSLMGAFKYKRKPSFFTAASLSQISEFSLILALLGYHLGHIDSHVFALLTLVGIVSIAFSTYLMNFMEKIYPYLSKYMKVFERPGGFDEIDTLSSYDVILFGCNRVGFDFIEAFKELGTKFLAVDYDPEIVAELLTKQINTKYGDADDSEFLEDIRASSAKAVVSTIPDAEINIFLVTKLKAENPNIIAILTSHSVDHAIELYERGADYVIVPHFIGGQVVSSLAKDAVMAQQDLRSTKQHHIEYLKHRKELGHGKRFIE